MSYLLDTNIISEIRKGAACNSSVAAWWAHVKPKELYLSALVLGEIRKGLEILRPRDPARAAALETWLAQVIAAFGERILPVDSHVAEYWGRLAAQYNPPIIDGLLAATAAVHDLVLVTRNTCDVDGLGVRVLDPFAP